MPTLYDPKDVRDLLSLSASAVRNYADRYAAHLSTHAQATPRRFNEDDLRLFAYVRQQTEAGQTHDDVLAQVAAAALADFDWQPPSQEEQEYQAAEQEEMAALVPVSQLRAAMAMLEDARRREEEAQERLQDREEALQDRIAELQRELGKVEGELAAVKASRRRAPGWWRAIFGGREE